MTLPAQQKASRMTDSTVGDTIDNHISDLENAVADILGISLDTNINDPITPQPWGHRGLRCENLGGTSTNTMDLGADIYSFYAPGLPSYRRIPASNIACGMQVFGAGGRDQAGAFANSSWIHFYTIFNPTSGSILTISSLTPPPTGPTLPSGFTHWCYMLPVLLNAFGNLSLVVARGNWVWYRGPGYGLLANGIATTNTSLATPLASAIPPNALNFQVQAQLSSSSISTGGQDDLALSVAAAGVDFIRPCLINPSPLVLDGSRETFVVPNISRQLWYRIFRGSTGGVVQANISVLGYQVPNGG